MPTVLQQQNRQGTFTSSSVVVPTPQPGQEWVFVTLNISPSDLASTKSIRVAVEASADDGQTWQHVGGMAWQGPTATQPELGVQLTPLAGQRARAWVDIPVTTRVGASIEFGSLPR